MSDTNTSPQGSVEFFSRLKSFKVILEYFLPVHPPKDALPHRSALLLIFMIFGGGVALFGFALSQAISEVYSLAAISTIVAVILFLFLFWFRAGKSHTQITYMFMGVSYCGQLLGAIHSGGIFSFTLPSMAIFPLFAFVLLGNRSGVLWGSLVVLSIFGLYMLEFVGLSLAIKLPTRDLANQVLGNLMMLMFYGVILVYWQYTNNRLHQEALEKATQEANVANESKSRFLANMSHELRTPMNGIIGLTELTLKRKKLDSIDAATLSTVLHSSHTMVRLLDDLLDLSRAEAGMLLFEKEPLQPSLLVQEVFELLGEQARQQKVNLQSNLTPDLGFGVGDPNRIRQVLLNLIGNAIKFTQDGSVQVNVRRNQDKVLFEIKDDGIGIPAETLPKLFQPFVQADASTTRRFGGSGLGLAISKNLVNIMGGTLRATSTVDKGSTFVFEVVLPSCPPPTEKEKEKEKEKERKLQTSSPRIRSVLVAEDNPINREVILRQLEALQLNVTLAEDGLTVLELIKEENFDLVFMDLHMPHLDGLEATRKARSQGFSQPIIAMTASALLEDRQAALEAGMNDFLTKPVTFDSLKLILSEQESKLRLSTSKPG